MARGRGNKRGGRGCRGGGRGGNKGGRGGGDKSYVDNRQSFDQISKENEKFERYYNALKGFGATTRFVLLPYESHGYTAKESLLHMLSEMNGWLDAYVKNPKSTAQGQAPSKVGDGK